MIGPSRRCWPEYLDRAGYLVTARETVSRDMPPPGGKPSDAVILDVMLPDGDGLDLCRRLRAESDVPVLMLTARGDPPDRIVGLEIGADDYLPKPFNPRELLARLRANPAPARRAGGAYARRFDSGRSRSIGSPGWFARRRGAIDHESPVRAPLGACDPCGSGADPRRPDAARSGRGPRGLRPSIDVHVSRIRQAIEDDPRRPRRILTVRGGRVRLLALALSPGAGAGAATRAAASREATLHSRLSRVRLGPRRVAAPRRARGVDRTGGLRRRLQRRAPVFAPGSCIS